MSMYSEAVEAVSKMREQKQHYLDEAADLARYRNITATRAALRNLVPDNDPMRPVAELLAESLTIGRSDGYPSRVIGKEAHNVYVAAIRALGNGKELPLHDARKEGLLKILGGRGYDEPYVSLERITAIEQDADYKAWRLALDYREAGIGVPKL